MFIDGWREEEKAVYNAILLSLKKKGNPIISATQVNVEDIMLSGISHSRKDKYCMIVLTRSI